MDNLEELADELASHILTSMQASIMMSHMTMAKLLGEGIVSSIDTMSEQEKYVLIAARPCGKLVMAVMIGEVYKAYLLEAFIDEQSGSFEKMVYVAEIPDNQDTQVIWEGLVDDIYEWADGKLEKIEIGY